MRKREHRSRGAQNSSLPPNPQFNTFTTPPTQTPPKYTHRVLLGETLLVPALGRKRVARVLVGDKRRRGELLVALALDTALDEEASAGEGLVSDALWRQNEEDGKRVRPGLSVALHEGLRRSERLERTGRKCTRREREGEETVGMAESSGEVSVALSISTRFCKSHKKGKAPLPRLHDRSARVLSTSALSSSLPPSSLSLVNPRVTHLERRALVLVLSEALHKAVEDVGLGAVAVHGVKAKRSRRELEHDGKGQVNDLWRREHDLGVDLARALLAPVVEESWVAVDRGRGRVGADVGHAAPLGAAVAVLLAHAATLFLGALLHRVVSEDVLKDLRGGLELLLDGERVKLA